MNRKTKGWLAEVAVKRLYESTGLFEVRNLATTEPASDLLVIDKNSGTVMAEIEVKYGRQPGDLDLGEKKGIWAAAQRCESLGRIYGLYCVIPTLGPRGQPVALKGHSYTIKALEPSKVRSGLSLKVFNTGSVDLPMTEGGQGGKLNSLPPFTTSKEE